MRSVVQGHASPLKRALTYAPLVVAGLLVGLTLVGCGSSSRTSTTTATPAASRKAPSVCRLAAAEAIARVVGMNSVALKTRATTGNNASPECHFRGPRVVVVVNVDPSPQAYQRLERTIVEDGQQFGEARGFTPPQTVKKLGLDASWLPDQSKLITTDGARLITVTVGWRGERLKRQLWLAVATARRYLGPLEPKAAEPNGG